MLFLKNFASAGNQAIFFLKPEEVEKLVAETLRSFGQLDILVNNAGTSSSALLKDMTLSEWDEVMNLDLRATFLCTKAVIGHMLQRKFGRILFIAGELAHTGGEAHSHVSAAKAGVVAFCKSVARELGRDNIMANVISPGPIRTPLLESISPEYLQKYFGSLPVGHFGEVEDIARAAIFLVRESNTYITGQTLLVNGGNFML
jgi:3-oxoacyl-[acyl-carrier protein] reductase